MATVQTQTRPIRVVIVGAGFAGLEAVHELRSSDAEVLLLDRVPYNTFQPLLYQVATGGLNPGDITYALRVYTGRFRNTRFRHSAVVGLDPDRKQLQLADGDTIDYDRLIIGVGVTANYFGIEGADKYAMTIYSRNASIAVRDRIFANLEAVAQGSPTAVEPVVVVVGGGATGVEMAGALAELSHAALQRAFPEIDPGRVRVVLVEMLDELLAPFKPPLRKHTAAALRARGVELRLGRAVKEVHPDCVVLDDGERLPSAATIWATGVKADDRLRSWGLPQGKGGRIEVDDHLRVRGHPEIFAVGDVGVNPDDPLPQLAQPAIQTGRYAARLIARELSGEPDPGPFRYVDKGIMATIGRSDAVVQLPSGIRIKGRLAWLAWVGLHIVTLIGNRNRFATMVNLANRYLSWPGHVNVIVGDTREPDKRPRP